MSKRTVKLITPPVVAHEVDIAEAETVDATQLVPLVIGPPRVVTAGCKCEGRSFVVTRSRPRKGGGYERYCDGCGVVQEPTA